MKVDFYYWSYQCPLNQTMIEVLSGYKERLEIKLHDISKNMELAQSMHMFFPTLTVVDDRRRYFQPISDAFMESLCSGRYPDVRPYLPRVGEVEKTGRIEPLTKDNISLACECSGRRNQSACTKKLEYLQTIGSSVFGYINVNEEGQLLGGAEYLPSMVVPYDIPKDEVTAFITCVYITDSQYDYKSAPLKALEESLASHYKRTVVISDEIGIFPNGNLDFFIRNGYHEEGIVFEEEGYCKLHLLSKYLCQ